MFITYVYRYTAYNAIDCYIYGKKEEAEPTVGLYLPIFLKNSIFLKITNLQIYAENSGAYIGVKWLGPEVVYIPYPIDNRCWSVVRVTNYPIQDCIGWVFEQEHTYIKHERFHLQVAMISYWQNFSRIIIIRSKDISQFVK